MIKRKNFYKVKFPAKVIEEAHDLFLSKHGLSSDVEVTELSISFKEEGYSFDTREEFLAAYPKANSYRFDHIKKAFEKERLIIDGNQAYVQVLVESKQNSIIEGIFNVFEKNVNKSKIHISAEPVKIFIGHGQSKQWKDLKDHLSDKHGYPVTAYEIGPRAGESVKDVLKKMLDESGFAVLVMTGEDQDIEGKLHARENVIHEIGLFQGHLGFNRAIILLENGVEQFSNILGINHIKFSKDNIRESFGDILAVLKKEFSD